MLPSTASTAAATVQDAALHATGVAVAATEGSSFSGTVATFSPPSSQRPVGDYTATITWGDGNTSAGTIGAKMSVAAAGNFPVSGSNTYAEEGTYAV